MSPCICVLVLSCLCVCVYTPKQPYGCTHSQRARIAPAQDLGEPRSKWHGSASNCVCDHKMFEDKVACG